MIRAILDSRPFPEPQQNVWEAELWEQFQFQFVLIRFILIRRAKRSA
jgi:hypothetical protein